jgi:hypothetical protein
MTGRLGSGLVLRTALVAALALVALGGAAAGADAGTACLPPGSGPEVCLQVDRVPEGDVSASRDDADAYASFTATVANNSGQTVTHVALEVSPIVTETSDGFVLFSVDPSTGACSYNAASSQVRCELGKLSRGGSAQVELVLAAPTTPGEAALDFTASFDEGPSDQPENPGRRDVIPLTEVITILPPGSTANSFAPQGANLDLEIDKQGQEGGVALPPQDFSTTAALRFTGTNVIPFTCPSVCRGGDWFSATIPGTFAPAAEFDLFWPANLVAPKQTEKNFVVFYIAFAGAPVETIEARCDAQLSVTPCIKNVTLFKTGPLKGALAATVVRTDNGHMR